MQSFSRAVHLDPGNKDLWEDDLMWAYSLLQKREKLQGERKQLLEGKEKGVKIVEVENDIENDVDDDGKIVDIYRQVHEQGEVKTEEKSIRKLPMNYIQMRDMLPP